MKGASGCVVSMKCHLTATQLKTLVRIGTQHYPKDKLGIVAAKVLKHTLNREYLVR